MTAVWLRVRGELRRHWRSWLAIAVVAGLAGGIVIAAAAGARRTDTAVARHASVYELPDVWIDSYDIFGSAGFAPWENAAPELAALRQVKAAALWREAAVAVRDAHDRPVLTMAVRVSLDGHDGKTIDRWKLIAGRRPNDHREHEALLDTRAAKTLGVHVGDFFHMRFFENGETANYWGDPETMKAGQLETLHVVGIKATTDPITHPAGVVRLTPAFYDAHILDGYSYGVVTVGLRLAHGAADVHVVRSTLREAFGEAAFGLRTGSDQLGPIQQSIHLHVQALWLGAAFAAVLAFLLVASAIVRTLALGAAEHSTLKALGMSGRQLVAVDLVLAAIVAVAATVLAIGVAVALSPTMPLGLAGELEPDPGVVIDGVVLTLGAVGVLGGVVLAGLLAADRSARRASAPTFRVGPADALGRWGLPPSLVAGVRLALARGSGAVAVPTATALAGVVVAVAAAVAAMTFTSSLNHLFATPRLYGQTWDYRSFYIDDVPVKAQLDDEPDVQAASFGYDTIPVHIAGRVVTVRAMDPEKGGGVPPLVTDGRAPSRRGEIMLGRKLAEQLGLGVGGTVWVRGQIGEQMHIVGTGIVAGGPSPGFGLVNGAAMTATSLEHLEPAAGDVCCGVFEVRVAPGADRAATLRRLVSVGNPMASLPRTLADFGGVDNLPLVITVLLAAIAAGALAQTLVLATRRRRRELAILKTLGFDRRQVIAAVFWYGATLVVLGLLVGVPAGLIAGRWSWNLFADELGVVVQPATPVFLIALVLPAALLVAGAVALVPGRMAAGARPALALRAE